MSDEKQNTPVITARTDPDTPNADSMVPRGVLGGCAMTYMTNGVEICSEHKFTAAQVVEDCPAPLQDLGKFIAVHLDKARKCEDRAEQSEDRADQHYKSACQFLAKAKEICDEGGFTAFREKFFPALAKTRVYELLQIANGKKSPEEIRASNRARVAKHRADKATSVTVTESVDPMAGPADPDAAAEETTTLRLQPPKPRRSFTPGDEAVFNFTTVILEVGRLTRKKRPDQFMKTAVSVGELARVGRLLCDLATLKMSVNPLSDRPMRSEVSDERSVDAKKAMHGMIDVEQAAA